MAYHTLPQSTLRRRGGGGRENSWSGGEEEVDDDDGSRSAAWWRHGMGALREESGRGHESAGRDNEQIDRALNFFIFPI